MTELRPRCLSLEGAVLAALIGLSSSMAGAEPIVVTLGTGAGQGEPPVVVPLDPVQETALDLWIRHESPYLGYSLSFVADPGMEIRAYLPAPLADASHDLVSGPGGRLVTSGGDGFALFDALTRVGTLVISGQLPGAELRLEAIAGAEAPTLVLTDFSLLDLATPRRIARVPEPRRMALASAIPLVALCALRRRFTRSRVRDQDAGVPLEGSPEQPKPGSTRQAGGSESGRAG